MPQNDTDQNKIHSILGNNNILIIIPDGRCEKESGEKGYLTELGIEAAKKLDCYAVINNKYRKTLIDFTDVKAIKKRKKITDAFLLKIKTFKDEISQNDLPPLLLILQVHKTAPERKNHLLIGYGQGERGAKDRPHRPTISPSAIAKYRVALDDSHFVTDIAKPASTLCGRNVHHINQLFRQKNYVEDFYDPTVRSLLLTLSPDIIEEEGKAKIAATALAHSFRQFRQDMSIVRRIETDNIDIETTEDLQYIFRIHNDTRYNELTRESYIDELSSSIEKNGLLHPLVLLQKNDGRYKILCGFRRFQAIKRIPEQWVEAKVFQERNFSTEDFFNISLAENTKRRNLNPVEIGNFLETASQTMGLNNTLLAEQFGETLGIGTPGSKVSHSTVHKYRKVNQIRIKGESPEIINDVINEQLSFSIVAEVLAPIKTAKNRDCLYIEIIKPLSPTRPQLLKILSLLKSSSKSLQSAIQNNNTKKIIAKAMESKQKAGTFIKLYQHWQAEGNDKDSILFSNKITNLRKTYFGDSAGKKVFDITPDKNKKDSSYNLKLSINSENYIEVLEKVKALLTEEKLL